MNPPPLDVAPNGGVRLFRGGGVFFRNEFSPWGGTFHNFFGGRLPPRAFWKKLGDFLDEVCIDGWGSSNGELKISLGPFTSLVGYLLWNMDPLISRMGLRRLKRF